MSKDSADIRKLWNRINKPVIVEKQLQQHEL